ncbi:unnamed protein product, partial [Lymnaea stagnalis]
GPAEDDLTVTKNCSTEASPCKEGLLLPMWTPQGRLSAGDKTARATVYMVTMFYLFLGVSIIADRFMAAIEVITSKEKEVIVKRKDGTTQVLNVRIWNETVSNLTLMALGSSAPEILLSIIEVCGNNFDAGELGPGTIVGSAAFNLFIIIAICVYVVPDKEVRRIKHLRVFFITATWSVFAYLWLYFILAVISPGVVDIWEAVLTFLFFPLTVLTAYIADRKLLVYKYLTTKYTATTKSTMMPIGMDAHEAEVADGKVAGLMVLNDVNDANSRPAMQEFEEHRKDFIEIIRELRKKHPNVDSKTLEEMAEYEAVNKGPKSRAFYRIQATRLLTGGGKVIKKAKIEKLVSESESMEQVEEEAINYTQVFFDPGHYTVMENVGTFNVTVTREGGDMSCSCYVDYHTEDGTANAGNDYVGVHGTLVFQPYEKHKQFEITVLDDDVFEEDEHFYVQLSNPRLSNSQGTILTGDQVIRLTTPFMATVMILDDDHPGIFHFEVGEMTVTENQGEVLVKVVRSSGARGRVSVPYQTLDGTAKLGKDYEVTSGAVLFENDQAEQFIKIRIIDDEEYEKKEQFSLALQEPVLVKKRFDSPTDIRTSDSGDVAQTEEELGDMVRPSLGDLTKIVIYIKESEDFKTTVDKLLKKANVSNVIGTSSWREQFVDAVTVSSGDDDEEVDGGDDDKLPSCMDYVMHFLTLFWKLTFAFVPPTDYFGGWACFLVSILMIGFLTAIIGDVAASFGCTVGLKDSITAISFVALGTSVPDTFASKVAAIHDKYADSSIGNVTGSNAVNVFLGIGIAWTIAAIYHASKGNKFVVPPGNLAISVTVFCVLALLTIMIMMARRHPRVGGELGGPRCLKYLTTIVLTMFWIIYLLISSMVTYCYIPGF